MHFLQFTFIWFLASCLLGYWSSAMVISWYFGYQRVLELLALGMFIGVEYALRWGGPVFLCLIIPYFFLDRKFAIDKKWSAICAFALIVAATSALLKLYPPAFLNGDGKADMPNHPSDLTQLMVATCFFGTWTGLVLSRKLIKSLNPYDNRLARKPKELSTND